MGAKEKSYNQHCPVAHAADVLSGRWTFLILRNLLGGARRFNDIRKGIPRISPTLLTDRLKHLEGRGLLEKVSNPENGYYEYVPTQSAYEVGPIINILGIWGQRWMVKQLPQNSVDIGIFMWDVQWRIDPAHFPAGQSTIGFEFTGYPNKEYQRWWVVVEDSVDLCPVDPGFETDLYVVTDIETLLKVWMGDISAVAAIREEKIDLQGRRDLVDSFSDWFPLSHYAIVPYAPEPLDLNNLMDKLNGIYT